MSGSGYSDPLMPYDPYDDPRPNAKNKLMIPAIALIILGVLSVANAIVGSLMSGAYRENLHQQLRKIEQNQNISADQKKVYKNALTAYGQYLPIFNGISAVCGAVIAIGGYQMLTLSARTLCYFAAILSILPFANCCCCLGMVFGVWAIIVMNLPDVQAGFSFQLHLAHKK